MKFGAEEDCLESMNNAYIDSYESLREFSLAKLGVPELVLDFIDYEAFWDSLTKQGFATHNNEYFDINIV